MPTYYTATGSPVVLEKKIAAGGEGTVYHMKGQGFSNHCAKIYDFTKSKPEDIKNKETKIRYMATGIKPSLPNANIQICWPLELLYENKNGTKFLGFIMNLAFSDSKQLYHLTMPKHSLSSDWDKFNRSEPYNIVPRLKLCANVAVTVHSIHNTKKYVFVDLNPRNILVTSDGKISIIDTDSMQVQDGQNIFHGPVSTPDYTPPENVDTKKNIISQTWDSFQLSVLFYEIMMGIHPYAGTAKPPHAEKSTYHEKIKLGLFVNGKNKLLMAVTPNPHLSYQKLPTSIQNLFVAAFDAGTQNPNNRPTAEIWGKTIISEIKNAPLPPIPPKKKSAPLPVVSPLPPVSKPNLPIIHRPPLPAKQGGGGGSIIAIIVGIGSLMAILYWILSSINFFASKDIQTHSVETDTKTVSTPPSAPVKVEPKKIDVPTDTKTVSVPAPVKVEPKKRDSSSVKSGVSTSIIPDYKKEQIKQRLNCRK